MTKYNLELEADGYFSDYDMKSESDTMNEFAAAAGQFFWSMFPETLGAYDRNGRSATQQPLSDFFYSPGYLTAADGFDGFMR